MKFDKSMLSEIEYISLALENCEDFDIDNKDILDFWTSEVKMGVGHNGENEIDDGGLVISKKAFHNLSSFATQEYADGTTPLDHEPEEIYYLYNRIIDCCDICQVHVKFTSGKKIWFFVPYNPLENKMHGSEVDLSNCPSAELDENGNMLILFGQSSHAYKRIDDNYFDLIIGLKEELKQPLKDTLEIKLEKFSNVECDYRCPRLFVDLHMVNKGYLGKRLSLVFENVANVHYEISFNTDEKRHLYMSRISTGQIFVEIDDVCTFYCHAVKTYSAYCGEDEDDPKYDNEEIYKRALNCELNEKEMELFAANHFAHSEKDFNLSAFVAAKQKVLKGDVSVRYFTRWLQSYSEMVQFYRETHITSEKFCHLAMLMDRLQIQLTYFENIEDCKQLIEKYTKEIENYYKNFHK